MVRLRRERWLTPDGRTVVAPMPAGVTGHFGPELRRFVPAQYACKDYRAILTRHGLVQSMSRKGDCWDNAPMESLFGSLKTELVHRTTFPTREVAKRAVFEYLEIFYNRRRRHSGLGFLTPAQAYEQMARIMDSQAQLSQSAVQRITHDNGAAFYGL